MSSRVIPVYSGRFPTMEEMMFPDPGNPHQRPEEIWPSQMEEHEIALFCVNFKSTGPVSEETGWPQPRNEQTCRVFSSLEDATAYARTIVQAHASTVCVLRSKSGAELKRISNTAFLTRVGLMTFLALGIWVVAATSIGFGVLWLVRGLVRGSTPGIAGSLRALSPWQWLGLAAACSALGVVLKTLRIWWRVRGFAQSMNTSLSPEEKARYQDVDRLAASPDAEDRKRAQELYREYQQRVFQVRREMK